MHARLIDIASNRNRHGLFADRAEAGRVMAGLLAPELAGTKPLVVLAIPSGGVPVGLEVSRALAAPLDLLIVRKLQIPGNPEAGFGAMGLTGRVFLNEPLVARLRLRPEEIAAQKAVVAKELAVRNAVFRHGQPPPDLAGSTALIVDDGLASGFTMRAALAEARTLDAGSCVVAVPTASRAAIDSLAEEAEVIVCANVQEAGPFAVASAYRHWYDVSRQEVVALLTEAAQHGSEQP